MFRGLATAEVKNLKEKIGALKTILQQGDNHEMKINWVSGKIAGCSCIVFQTNKAFQNLMNVRPYFGTDVH